MKTPVELAQHFRATGKKSTPQRQMIFAALENNQMHPTAEAIFDQVRIQLPSISLRTVYQTLHDLVEMGEIRQVDLGGGLQRFDPNTDDHHHVICEKCGEVNDTYISAKGIPELVESNFHVSHVSMTFHGICESCQYRQQTTAKNSKRKSL